MPVGNRSESSRVFKGAGSALPTALSVNQNAVLWNNISVCHLIAGF